VPELADPSGYIDSFFLFRDDGQLKDASQQGLKFLHIDKRCAKWWSNPCFITICQSALNTRTETGFTEMEGLLAVHDKAAVYVDAHMPVDWEACKAAGIRNNPPFKAYIGDMVEYVKVNSGGPQGVLLRELSLYMKTLIGEDYGSKRNLGGSFISWVAAFKGTPTSSWSEKYAAGAKLTSQPYIQQALMKGQLCCPSRFVEHGLCKFIQESHVKALKRHPELLLGETMMQGARALVASAGVEGTRLVGLADARIIYHLTGLDEKSSAGVFPSLTAIGEAPYIVQTSCMPMLIYSTAI